MNFNIAEKLKEKKYELVGENPQTKEMFFEYMEEKEHPILKEHKYSLVVNETTKQYHFLGILGDTQTALVSAKYNDVENFVVLECAMLKFETLFIKAIENLL